MADHGYVRLKASEVVHEVFLDSDRVGRARSYCNRAFGSAFDAEARERSERLTSLPEGTRPCKTCRRAKGRAEHAGRIGREPR